MFIRCHSVFKLNEASRFLIFYCLVSNINYGFKINFWQKIVLPNFGPVFCAVALNDMEKLAKINVALFSITKCMYLIYSNDSCTITSLGHKLLVMVMFYSASDINKRAQYL